MSLPRVPTIPAPRRSRPKSSTKRSRRSTSCQNDPRMPGARSRHAGPSVSSLLDCSSSPPWRSRRVTPRRRGSFLRPPARATLFELQRNHQRDPRRPGAGSRHVGRARQIAGRTTKRCTRCNAHKLLMPASTQKILTLAVAADQLGWDFTYRTASSRLARSKTASSKATSSSSDPAIRRSTTGTGSRAARFAEWAAVLKRQGIRTIDGRIIGDDNAFDDEGLGSGMGVGRSRRPAIATGVGGPAVQSEHRAARRHADRHLANRARAGHA